MKKYLIKMMLAVIIVVASGVNIYNSQKLNVLIVMVMQAVVVQIHIREMFVHIELFIIMIVRVVVLFNICKILKIIH